MRHDDPTARVNWVSAHDMRHKTLQLSASRAGKSFPRIPLDGTVDEDWFARHWVAHKALASFLVHSGESTMGTFLSSGWDTPEQFYNWHKIHNDLHQALDHQMKVL
jgi:hypothetical protein